MSEKELKWFKDNVWFMITISRIPPSETHWASKVVQQGLEVMFKLYANLLSLVLFGGGF